MFPVINDDGMHVITSESIITDIYQVFLSRNRMCHIVLHTSHHYIIIMKAVTT